MSTAAVGRTNRIGRHLGTSAGLGKTVRAAARLGCETVQIFVSNPQGWAKAPTQAAPTLTLVTVQ